MSGAVQQGRLRREWWLMLFVCLLGTAGLDQSRLAGRLDNIAYDLLLSHRAKPVPEGILIVALDDRSLAGVGAWPWSRTTQARLIDQIAAGHPRAIGLDVLLTDRGEPAGDAALAGAIRAAGNVYLPLAVAVPGSDGRSVDLLRPRPMFAQGAAGIGHVNLSPDEDGVMRSTYLAYGVQGQGWAALPTLMAGRVPQLPAPSPALTRSAPILIDYPGSAGTISSVSAASMLRGEVPGELIAGKFVFVGMTASGLGDMHAVPATDQSPLMPGVEIQASVLASLLAPQLLVPVPPVARLAFALAAVVALFAAMGRLPTHYGVSAAAGLLVAIFLASAAAFYLAGWWFPPASAAIGVAAGYVLWSWRRLAVASAYVSRELERATAEAGGLAQPIPANHRMLDRQLALLADTTARERELRLEHDAVIRLLSHDMRAPQSAILALLDADRSLEPGLSARIGAYARRTLELADGFVHLSRAQLLAFAPEPVDLAECARDAADAVWPQANARGIVIAVECPVDEVLVSGDRSLLTRLFINLVDNALKYGDGPATVTVLVAPVQGEAHATVSNSGPDIPADQLDRLFARFARGSGATHRVDGVGLGLAFVHTVAVRHGGRVTCRSGAGETCFSVMLPLDDQPPAP